MRGPVCLQAQGIIMRGHCGWFASSLTLNYIRGLFCVCCNLSMPNPSKAVLEHTKTRSFEQRVLLTSHIKWEVLDLKSPTITYMKDATNKGHKVFPKFIAYYLNQNCSQNPLTIWSKSKIKFYYTIQNCCYSGI